VKTNDIDPRSSLRFDYKKTNDKCKWTLDYDNTISSKFFMTLTGCDKTTNS